MKEYNFREIEKKWAEKWVEDKVFTPDLEKAKNPYYALFMFPYPSGEGLHMGHAFVFSAVDAIAKFKKLQGYDVFEPVGWDAFGIHSENYALKIGETPKKMLDRTTGNFTEQLRNLGIGCDWTMLVDTTKPEYYKWTQWIFTKLFEKGLAYQKEALLNWCPSCKTVLADEQIIDGECERCGTKAEKKKMKQWFFKITAYAQRLLDGLEEMDWSDITKAAQKNWIGRSEGAEIEFKIHPPFKSPLAKGGQMGGIRVFTTRPDTLFGATYMVLSPEHELVKEITLPEQKKAVGNYIKKAGAKSDLERTESKEKTGVFTGAYAINPVNNEKIPIWVADYVLTGYGTGAIMAVPAHDERDFEFAKKFDLPIRTVVEPCFITSEGPDKVRIEEPIVDRDAIAAIVKHWKNDSYIVLKWKQADWKTFITGGPENGQTMEEAARNEILEETGYKNLKLIKELPRFHSKFYHIPKKINRFAHMQVFYFELKNDECQDISKIEKERHEVVWVPKKDVESLLTAEGHKFAWRIIQKPDTIYTDYGILTDSGKFSGMSSMEAIKAITDFAGGKLIANYKLRDWCISRQRYWGPPVPVVYCKKCRNEKYNYILLHGRQGSSQDNFFPWLKNKLESLGNKVYCPDLPDAFNPKVEDQADFVIKNTKIDENTIILGHSLGGPVALKILEKTGKKVARVLLLDSPLKPEFNDKRRPDLEKNFNWKFNFEKIKKLAEFIILADKNLPIIPKEQTLEYNRLLNASKIVFEKSEGEHFCSDIEPVILEYLIPNGIYSIPEKDLPVLLPELEKGWEPAGDGKGPLAKVKSFMQTTCPKCSGPAEREADVMDNFLDSAWYFFRYISPKNNKEIFDPKLGKKWLPVDLYIGGNEHAVLHLMYTRFITMALHDLGVIDFDNPFKRFRANGMVLKDGKKMSKSKGNIIRPEDYGEKVGYDALKTYLLFLGPLSEDRSFTDRGILGTKRWAEKVSRLEEKVSANHKDGEEIVRKLHQTIKKLEEEFEDQKYNTSVAKLMELTNDLTGAEKISQDLWKKFLVIIASFLPALSEELWSKAGNKDSIFSGKNWPKYDAKLAKNEEIELVVQINGKLRDRIKTNADISEKEAKNLAMASEKIKKFLESKKVKKVIFVNGKLVNIVV